MTLNTRIFDGFIGLVVCTVTMLRVSAGVASELLVDTPEYRVYRSNTDIDEAAARSLSKRSANVRRRIADFLGDNGAIPKLDYHVYPSFEAKGLATGNAQLAHADIADEAIHLVINDWIRGDDDGRDALVLLRNRMGKPDVLALETGLSIYFTDAWREKGYEYWASLLHSTSNALRLADLLDNDAMARQSYLVAGPLAATFVAFAIDHYGKTTFIETYATWQPNASEIAMLEHDWQRYLDRLSETYRRTFRQDRKRWRVNKRFQKGFCHAHEGYRIHDGYLSKKSDQALLKLAELGTNAVSITPFSYMRDPTKPIPFRFSHGAREENDESVIHSAHTAHDLGMTVMLKPHIWLRRSWPGAIEMETPEQWQAFFDYYYRWMLHYALLAEMYDIEVLCAGVELGKATVGHEAEWRDMVKKFRGVYGGQITYAANWGEEFENVSFWDAFDFIGINCYYPLSDLDSASVSDLKIGADQIAAKIEAVYKRYKRPVLITEIGFTSTATPWKRPHEAAWQKTAYQKHQPMCYEVIFESLYQRKWCKGIYWWKWPSFLEFGGAKNPGFTPNGKPAEKIVRDWYRKRW